MLKKITIALFLIYLCLGLLLPSISLSQPPEKFFILNLHWDSRTICLNTIHIAQGNLKKNRSVNRGNTFVYRLLSNRNEVLEEGFFEIPHLLYFDYLDNDKGQLQGGRLPRVDADFVIKIPVYENFQRVLFYRLKEPRRSRINTTHITAEELAGDVLGEIKLQ
jgi:hypothetical protein